MITRELSLYIYMQEELFQKEREGSIETYGDKDILSIALDTPEHSGRVRGLGMWITPTIFFGPSKRGRKKEYSPGRMERVEKKLEDITRKYNDLEQRQMGSSRKDMEKSKVDSPPPSSGPDKVYISNAFSLY